MYDAPGALEYSLAAQKQSKLAGIESVYDTASILETIGSAYALAHRSDLAQEYFRAALGTVRAGPAAAQPGGGVGAPELGVEQPGHRQPGAERSSTSTLPSRINKELAPNVQESAITLGNRARSLVQLGRFADATAQFEAASLLATRRENAASQAAIAVGLAGIATSLGQFERAEGHLEQAAKALQSKELPARPIRWCTIPAGTSNVVGSARQPG